jgi:hypothetical protein
MGPLQLLAVIYVRNTPGAQPASHGQENASHGHACKGSVAAPPLQGLPAQEQGYQGPAELRIQ